MALHQTDANVSNHAGAQALPDDRSQPIIAPLFDELHEALESLRRKSDEHKARAVRRLAEASSLCRSGRYREAVQELQTLTREIAVEKSRSSSPSPHWRTTGMVVLRGAT